jgi:hypothetical protein
MTVEWIHDAVGSVTDTPRPVLSEIGPPIYYEHLHSTVWMGGIILYNLSSFAEGLAGQASLSPWFEPMGCM